MGIEVTRTLHVGAKSLAFRSFELLASLSLLVSYLCVFICFEFYNFSNYWHQHSIERKKWCGTEERFTQKVNVFLKWICQMMYVFPLFCDHLCSCIILTRLVYIYSKIFIHNKCPVFGTVQVQDSSHQRWFYFKPLNDLGFQIYILDLFLCLSNKTKQKHFTTGKVCNELIHPA